MGKRLDNATALYVEGINDGNFVAAINKYAGDRYTQHSTPVKDGKDGFIEFFAEIDLFAALSACPGGDCGAGHSDDVAPCYPLKVEIFETEPGTLDGWAPAPPNGYSRSHGA